MEKVAKIVKNSVLGTQMVKLIPGILTENTQTKNGQKKATNSPKLANIALFVSQNHQNGLKSFLVSNIFNNFSFITQLKIEIQSDLNRYPEPN